MATMIPAEFPENGDRFERDLFEKFKRLPADWTIVPQFFVGTGGPRPRELDFVILIPTLPTSKSYSVVYLEAKGGGFSIRNRQWFRGDDLVDQTPPEQARSGMFEFQKQFQARYEHFGGKALRLSFSYAVAFADWNISSEITRDADVTKGALLMGSWDVHNGNRMMQLLGEHANEARKKFDRRQNFNSIERWNKQEHEVAAVQLKAMEVMLNPPPTPVTSNTFFRHNLDTLLPELLELTDSQETALNLIKGNARCVIDGAAGTGKTVLAMETVRQRCEQEGDTVALLCSNPLLIRRLEQWAEETLSSEQGGRMLTGTPASLLAHAFADDPAFLARHQQRLAEFPNLESDLKQGDLHSGWRGFVENTMQELERKPAVFDYLVIDEAQNLYDDVFLQLMDKLLKGGLAHGRWAMFGDFINQNIVTPRRGDSSENLKTALAAFGASENHTYWQLRTNCRNTYEIADATYNITYIEAPTRRGVHGPEVEFRYFDSNDQFHEMLGKQLAEWESYGYESKQIIMLTREGDSLFGQNRQYGNWRLVNIRERHTSQRRYQPLCPLQRHFRFPRAGERLGDPSVANGPGADERWGCRQYAALR